MTAMTPTILINPNENQVTNAVNEFDSLLSNGSSIHPVALSRLKNPRHEFSNPFPRIESHDDYLFGVLATPTSLLDGEDLFITLTFIASFEKLIVVVRWSQIDPIDTQNQPFLDSLISLPKSFSSCGDFLVLMLDELINDLEYKIEIAHEQIDSEFRLLRESDYTVGEDLSKDMMDDLYGSASKYRIDILGFQTTVEETQRVLEDIAKDRVDLKPKNPTSQLEFFPKHLEIEVSDLVFRVRHLVLLRRSLETTLSFSFSKFEKMRDELQTSAQHKIAAIASIMLLPTFIVGLFGQNFRFGEELEQHWGLAISSALIVLTTIAQYFYFKRNKWL